MLALQNGNKMSNIKKLELLNYFADCALFCAKNPSDLWDGYVWDLKNVDSWSFYLNFELSPEQAVKTFFNEIKN